MEKILPIIKKWLPVFFAVLTALSVNAQSSGDICNSMGDNASISLKDASGSPLTSIKTGLDFNLILTLPGGLCQGGTYEVSVTTSDNMELGNQNPNYPFYSTGTNQFGNATVIAASNGIALNIPFKFKPGTTCNGAKGTFNVTIKLKCNGTDYKTCVFNQIGLSATAQNFWKVTKTHVWGNLRGGSILWDVAITNTNPNPGIGDLNIYSGSLQDVFTDGTITSVSGAAATINTTTATWSTGTIASTTSYVVYHVMTTSCGPAGTVVKNCVNYNFCLGGKQSIIIHADEHEKKAEQEKKLPPPGHGPVNPVLLCMTCAQMSGQECASVTLVGTAVSSAAFGKSLSYLPGILNYAPGCQAEYTIAISNNGNIPLTGLALTDPFPSNIIVTKINVYSIGASIDYTTNLQTGTFNTATNQSWPPNTASTMSNFSLTTASGQTLLGGTIYVKIRFIINASPGTNISNCANLNFSGTYGIGGASTTICGDPVPALSSGSTLQSCANFTVQQPTAIPGISKCIRNGQQSFSIGDIIPFRIVISNHGSANYSGNLADLLGGSSLQNLSLVTGSVKYSYGAAPFNPYSTQPGCMPDFSNISATPPSWTSVTQQASQNLGWNISNMPGNCELDTASYLIIDFDAKVLPQSFGNYINTATLGTLQAKAYYNVMRTAQISTTKNASSEYVEPGQPFNYIIDVKNEGSVALKNVRVNDVLPQCVTYSAVTAKVLDVNGALLSTTTVTGAPANYNLPSSLVLQPGQSVELTISVTRKANDKGDCCNPLARGSANTNDASSDNISDVDGPVCVKSSLCCQVDNLDVQLLVGEINDGQRVPVFSINAGTTPIQEVEISLIDYHVEYSDINCKPVNMGDLTGHIQPYIYTGYNSNSLPAITGSSPVLPLQTVINPVNSSLLWTATTAPVLLQGFSSVNSGLVILNFVGPDIIPLDCCSGEVYYCFKVRVKDVNCNVCEKLVCGNYDIPKPITPHPWVNDKAKNKIKLKSFEGNQGSVTIKNNTATPAKIKGTHKSTERK